MIIRKQREGGSGGSSLMSTRAGILLHLLFLWMLHVGDCTGTFITLTGRTTMAAAAFCPLTISQQQQQQQRHERSIMRLKRDHGAVVPTALWAKNTKKAQKKKGSGATSAATGPGGGFGVGASRRPSASAASPASAAATAAAAAAAATSATTASSSSFGTGAKALRKAANNYDEIRKRDGLIACRDVYVRSPLHNPNLYWFVGKIARQLPTASPSTSTISVQETTTTTGDENKRDTKKEEDDECCCTPFFMQAALFQKRLILDYSKMQLRPQNFGGKYAAGLELWLAPADSEMNVATNKASLCRVVRQKEKVVQDDDEADAAAAAPVSAMTVGYNPEIYLGDEIVNGGLRVERDENGNPTKAAYDVNESL